MVEVELLNWSGINSVYISAEGSKLTADDLRTNKIRHEEIVKMLVENDYSSALEHIWFTFRIKCSIACQRQVLEHRIASHTTRSTRYCREDARDICFPEEFTQKLTDEDKERIFAVLNSVTETYNYLEHKYGREFARYLLPLGLQTEFIWTINARSLINFLGLRLCVRASPEIRELAKKVHEIVKKLVPEIFENVGCRGVNLGVCPENEARPKNCPYRNKIPTKKEIKKTWYHEGGKQ